MGKVSGQGLKKGAQTAEGGVAVTGKRWLARALAGVVVLALAVVGVQTLGRAQRPVTLKIESSYPAGTQAWIWLTEYYKPAVEEMSAGRLRIDPLPPGAVVPAFEVADAVNKGVLDGGVTQGMYYVGKHPAGALFSTVPGGPFGMTFIDVMAWFFYGGGSELHLQYYNEALKMPNIGKVIPAINWGPQWFGWFKKPIRSMADMRGLKYRIPGIAGDVWKELGVSVVVLPGGEILPAGERGVIDAAEWAFPYDDIRLGFHNVWKYFHTPEAHSYRENAELMFNKQVWDGLSPDLKRILEEAAHASTLRLWARHLVDNARTAQELRTKYGVTIVRTPADVAKGYLEAWDKKVLPKFLQDPFFRRVWQSQQNFARLVVPYRRDTEPDYRTYADWYWKAIRAAR